MVTTGTWGAVLLLVFFTTVHDISAKYENNAQNQLSSLEELSHAVSEESVTDTQPNIRKNYSANDTHGSENDIHGLTSGLKLSTSSATTNQSIIYNSTIPKNLKISSLNEESTSYNDDIVEHSTKSFVNESNDDSTANKSRVFTKLQLKNLNHHVIEAAKSLRKALMHVRGTKTRSSIVEAISSTTNALELLNVSFVNVTARQTKKSPYVCPEIYKGSTYGFPLYRVGYVTEEDCTSTPPHKIVTLALLATNCKALESVIHGVRTFNMQMRIVIGLTAGCRETEKQIMDRYGGNYGTMKIKSFEQGTIGKLWNDVISFVRTEYVLILRNVVSFDNSDVRLERLVREIDSLGVNAVGGAVKDRQGRWKLGCHQRAHYNFSLVYREGYDESIHDCVFCDHIDGPFLVRTSEVKFDESLLDAGIFEDFFLRSESEFAVCPDSMFSVNPRSKTIDNATWSKFMDKWNLYKLQFSKGPVVVSNCNDTKFSCSRKTGQLQHPCCLDELTAMNSLVMHVCKRHGFVCEVFADNLLGAMKFKDAYPWQKNSTIRISSVNFTFFGKYSTVFQQYGYSFERIRSNRTGNDNITNKYKVSSDNWVVEVIPFNSLNRFTMHPPTLLPYKGQYITGPRNPALSARNMYMHNVFQHRRSRKAKTSRESTFCFVKNGDCDDRVDGNIFTKLVQP